ncbi:two-component system, NtrC family, sensor histidine kinase HydH [Myxococcaceae bacterium]|jgi:signal transduction histidine kinase|nr:two-component system, NtrC family, sensor histidine kinase HydH [Myxococcaceae bacterium]
MSSPRDLDQRLDFLGFGPEDLAALRALRPVLERSADRLVGAFYEHLQSFDHTRALLTAPGVSERLLARQREYLLSLAEDPRAPDHAEERLRIGATHERVGLAPRWYLGAYALYYSLLVPLVCEAYPGDRAAAERALVALQKMLMLDAQLAMEAYIERDRRELEVRNRQLADEGRTLAREIEEQQVELRQTRRRARVAEELASVATLVAGLAHEIGTPMGVIQGHAELLEPAVTAEKDKWRVRTIREQIDRISRIIQAVLSSARPRELERAPVELAPLLANTISFLAEKFRRRGIRLETDFRPVPILVGDAEKIQQLVLNLLLNAVDAMPKGGEIRVVLAPGGDSEVEIRVADTGVGIEAQALDRIFEPFYTTKPAGQGSGLGLVVAHGIVLDHDGRIEVTSEPGVGTEFRVVLPIRPTGDARRNDME